MRNKICTLLTLLMLFIKDIINTNIDTYNIMIISYLNIQFSNYQAIFNYVK